MITARLERTLSQHRGATGAFARDLQRLEWAPAEEVLADQRRRLTALLEHAARHVPYYARALAEAGVVGDGGEVDLDRFTRIPLLDKAIIRANFDDLTTDDLDHRCWKYDGTGGSTGQPVRLIHDQTYLDWMRAMPVVGDSMIGRHPGERRLYLWGSVHEVVEGQEALRTRVGRRLRQEIWLNTFRMSPERMRDFVATINRFRPVHIVAYAESAFELARFIEREGLTVHRPKTISTGAGALEAPMRAQIERVFAAPVFDQYGSREVGGIAGECQKHEGLHVTMPGVVVEVLRCDGSPAPAGELGELVVTPLFCFAQPLIRYRIGDMGRWAGRPCSCGRSWPLLSSVAGRVSGTFVAPTGMLVAGEWFNYVFYLQDWIERFQAIQETIHHIRARIVVRAGAHEADIERGKKEIVERVAMTMGDDCVTTFEFVDSIEPSPSGKYLCTISNVDWCGEGANEEGRLAP